MTANVRNKLKFPVLKNVEYIDIIKKGKTVLTFEPKDVEALTWRQFQKLLGSKLPDDSYNYVIKINKDDQIYKGVVRTAGSILDMAKTKVDSGSNGLEKQVSALADKINKLNNESSVPVNLLIEVTRQSFETQVSFLNMEISRKDATCVKLETKIESLMKELDDSEDEISELKEKTGMSQYISIAKELLTLKAGGLKPITNLEASESTDIPAEITQILGMVNWQLVPPDVLNEITNTMKIFIQKLPMKG